MPRMPSAATLGNALSGRRCFPRTRRNINGTAIRKRNAVNVSGGKVNKPRFVIGIERPHMTARTNAAARLLTDGSGEGLIAG